MSIEPASDFIRPILQYQVRRRRATSVLRGQRRKGRWQVIACHTLPALHPDNYCRLDSELMCHDSALKVANTLNTLNNLPIFE